DLVKKYEKLAESHPLLSLPQVTREIDGVWARIGSISNLLNLQRLEIVQPNRLLEKLNLNEDFLNWC
ncbi:MAG: hypothetical protein PVI40_06110, partial [Chlamydiota bacterium]